MTTLTDVLFDTPRAASATLATRLGKAALAASIIGDLSSSGLIAKLAARTVDALNSPLEPLFMQAWAVHEDVRAACDDTSSPGRLSKPVVLGDVTFVLNTPVDVTIQGRGEPARHLQFDLELTGTVDHITLTITNGRITQTTAATLRIDATLSWGEDRLASGSLRTIKLSSHSSTAPEQEPTHDVSAELL